MMRWFVICFCGALAAQNLAVSPQPVPQGDALLVRASTDAANARMNGRTIRLFPQKDGSRFGLMPVAVTDKPGVYELDILNATGSTIGKKMITVRDAHFPSQNVVISKSLSELKATPDEVAVFSAFRKEVLDDRHWAEPLAAPVPGCMTSLFGVQRLHNGKPTGDYHAGLDLRAHQGTPIHATAAGVVKIAGQFTLHGGAVAIDHGQGLQSVYMHMSKIASADGAAVQKGEVIGYSGSTGRSNAPHLHWSLYANGVAINPLQWVKVAPCSKPAAVPRRRRSRR